MDKVRPGVRRNTAINGNPAVIEATDREDALGNRVWDFVTWRPLDSDSRIAFGIEWYATEAIADEVGKAVRERGDRYNGGWFHGTPCGRSASYDRVVDGRKQFAVTVA